MDELRNSLIDLCNAFGFIPLRVFIKENCKDIYDFIQLGGGYERVKEKYGLSNLWESIENFAIKLEKNKELKCPKCGNERYINSGFNNNKTYKRYDCKNKDCGARYSSLMSSQKEIGEGLVARAEATLNPTWKLYLFEQAERLLANKFLQLNRSNS